MAKVRIAAWCSAVCAAYAPGLFLLACASESQALSQAKHVAGGPSEEDSNGRLAAEIRSALEVDPLPSFNGEVRFELEMHLPAKPESGRDQVDVVQSWRIVAEDGGRFLRGEVTWLQGEVVGYTRMFGETPGAFWTASLGTLTVVNKEVKGNMPEREYGPYLRIAEGYVQQARQELRNILDTESLRAAPDDSKFSNVTPSTSGASSVVHRDDRLLDVAFDRFGRNWVVSSIVKRTPHATLFFSLGDYQPIGDMLVPGWIHYRSEESTNGGETILYKGIQAEIISDESDLRERVNIPHVEETSTATHALQARIEYTREGTKAFSPLP
ncbi:MAG: hypothetical protein HS101_02090 [Planctomycetia bacterium]|jgi:hypothetical protein|nr:hypothetical protein [Planctomycetia bacterium]MCC7314985.1 hypothetical protein [Planctomycetota bacterium]OQZ05964.1 MAG: hypothetical protein B6D36_07430 [Planctomycetes bacterium UTPLA1]